MKKVKPKEGKIICRNKERKKYKKRDRKKGRQQ